MKREVKKYLFDKVDDVVIWGIVSIHLPKLKSEIEILLEEK